MPLLTRFLARVTVELDGCWRLSITPSKDGYVYMSRGGRSEGKELMHRWAYTYFVGPIPEGATLDHLCRHRWCVNPWHLEPVSRGENVLRGEGLSARHARQTHCLRGHPFRGSRERRTAGLPRATGLSPLSP